MPIVSNARWWRRPFDHDQVRRHARTAVAITALAAAYVGAAKLGLHFATSDGGVSAVWPASGVALAAVLRFGYRLWPGILIGATLGSVSLSVSLVAAGAEGMAATAQALVAVYLLRRGGFRSELGRIRDVALLYAVAPLAAALAATIGVGALVATDIVASAEYVSIAFVWFVGDTLGAVVVAPLLLVWTRRYAPSGRPSRVIEAMILSAVTVVSSLVMFDGLLPAMAEYPLSSALVPLVVWAALRFGRRGAVAAVAAISVIVVESTVRGVGPFVHSEPGTNLLLAQLFVGVLATTGLPLAALTAERRAGTTALRHESLRAQNQQLFLQATLDSLTDAVVACDANGRLTVFNRSTRELHGLPPQPIPPERWAEHYSLYGPDGTTQMSPEDVPLFRALNGERVQGAELVVVARKGPRRRLRASGQPIISEHGDRLGAVVAMQDVTEQKLLEEQLRHQAFHDPLTGLANRALFADRLEHALVRRGKTADALAILFLDLDDFKAINDNLGHEAGDGVLFRVAGAIQSSVREADTVARFGGDEFAILLEDVADRNTAVRTADRILRSLRVPLTIKGREISITASMGIAFPATGYQSAEDLLRNADLAMYRAKEKGKGRRELFELGMRTAALEQLETKADLQRAVRRREFRLSYQPIVEIGSGAVVGFEALVRWKHPVHGILSPEEFIGLAEQTGSIVPIGRWALKQACRQMAHWQRTLPSERALTMHVNISPRQLQDPDLEKDVVAALSLSGLAAQSLTLEVTESLLVDDPEGAAEKLNALKQLGLGIAIDDFGTGYSSLAYLTRFPIDTLKIDKAFVDTLEDGSRGVAVARLVIELCHTLNLNVIAEGVERQPQADLLRQLRCTLAQGYLFAQPLDARAVGRFMAASSGEANVAPDTVPDLRTPLRGRRSPERGRRTALNPG